MLIANSKITYVNRELKNYKYVNRELKNYKYVNRELKNNIC